MTRVQFAIAQPEAVSWPVDFTISERSALVTALAPRQLSAPLRAARRQLRRFLAPLEDVATALGLPESSRQRVQRFVLLGMLERDTAWGCWDATTWIEVAHSAGFYRANVLAVAARLGAITGRDLVRLCGQPTNLARRLFGRPALEREVGRVQNYLQTVGYGSKAGNYESLVAAIATLLIQAGNADLTAINLELIESAYAAQPSGSAAGTAYFRIAHVLHGMGILPRGIALRRSLYRPLADVDPEWAGWCARWRSTSTLSQKTIDAVYNSALRADAGWHATTQMFAARRGGRETWRASTSQP